MTIDPIETRSEDARAADQLASLQGILERLQDHDGNCLSESALNDLSDLRNFPVLRKDTLHAWQTAQPPFGGAMFESGARAVGMKVFPAGPGNTAQQAEVAAAIGTTAYIGTPDYLATILRKADDLGLDVSRINKAAVSAGPLFPQMRQAYEDRGITCRQAYGTADAGLIAYESTGSTDGMIIDENVILEIVTPGTGDPVAIGEIGEVLVTVLNPDYPLIRFSTGDLSAILPGQSPCGRTNTRIVGWRGRADQATKVKGMFIRPEQVATLVARHPEIDRARVEISHDGQGDQIKVSLETDAADPSSYQSSIAELLKLRADIELVAKGALPRDGIVVSDLRPVIE